MQGTWMESRLDKVIANTSEPFFIYFLHSYYQQGLVQSSNLEINLEEI